MDFEMDFEQASSLKKERYRLLINSLGDIKLTDKEKGYILWLAGWDGETCAVFDGIFFKLQNKGEREK
ncbi:MAG: hypothetical protein PHC40_03680 [Eubacteriales bacterium]|nr:hypothetical protein [Eubacteriales bacterium]